MSTELHGYCRFCAEEKPYQEITSLENLQYLNEKLSVLGLSLVDFSDKILPKTVCISCYELTTVSCEFILKVKRSQDVLTKLCAGSQIDCAFTNATVKAESDDEDYFQDDNLSSFEDAEEIPEEEKCVYAGLEVFIETNIQTEAPKTPVKSKKHTWNNYPWECYICGIKQVSLTELREHCESEHVKCFAFKCADCDQRQDCYDTFVAHVRVHRKGLRSYCEYCNMKLEDSTHYATHCHYCKHCGTLFDKQHDLYKHQDKYLEKTDGSIKTSTNEIRTWSDYPAICQFCQMKVIDKAFLIEHCIESHKTCFGSQCIDCDIRLNDFKSFVKHVKSHRPYLKNICPYCNIDITDDPSHITEHASAHSCLVCGVSFRLKRHLLTHLKITQQNEQSKHKGPPSNSCPVCGMIMKTTASLKGHLKTHTNRKRNYTCESCGKAYYTKGSLDIHRKTHDSSIKESCKICHKTFLTIPRLKKHVKTHNLELPYQCDNCKRFFSSKDRLREHVKVHSNILPFQCSYCSKKFRHRSIMKTHENQHTGARPYSCNLCCMDFANWSNCNKHMKRKHGTTLAKNVMTPHGKLALNPTTGKPDELIMDNKVKEWSEIMLMGRTTTKYSRKLV